MARNDELRKKLISSSHVLGHPSQNTLKSHDVSFYIPNLNSIDPSITALQGRNLEIKRWVMHVLTRSDTPLVTAVVS